MKQNGLIFFVLMLAACSQQPQPINYGKDDCMECKMTIIDKKFGAELFSTKGKTYKFDDIICMVKFMNSNTINENEISKKLIIDYQNETNFLDANQAFYYVADDVHSPMNGNAAAFANKQEALNYQNGKQGLVLNWNQVYEKLK